MDEDGKPVFTPATASDLAQSRILQKELAAEAQQEINNPYADDARGRAKLADALCDRGYSRAEAFEIINGKYKQ